MAEFNAYDQFTEDLGNKIHDLVGTDDVLKIALTNAAPSRTTHAVLADIGELSAGAGYTAGGIDTQNVGSESGGILRVTGVDVVWTATGSLGPFRYAVLYNETPTTPLKPLIGWWDYGESITLVTGQTFAVRYCGSLLIVKPV